MRNSAAILTGLYAITDDRLLPGEELLIKTEAALTGGCKLLQYRSNEQRLQQATELRALCRQFDCTFLINDDVMLADRVGADGVHLGQRDTSITEARDILGASAIIGITCHNSLALAQQAELSGADYVAFGRFYPSQTKPQAPLASLDILSRARRVLDLPIAAIGGITLQKVPEIIQQGANMAAVIHDLFACDDVEQQARAYQQLFML